MAPPRTYKTAFLADVILRYPGPVIATTTKPDLYALTSAVRAQLGPVHVFNPQHIGGVPSTFCWSPVDGCQDPATAIRRADAFAFAVSARRPSRTARSGPPKPATTCAATSTPPPWPGTTCAPSPPGSPAPTRTSPSGSCSPPAPASGRSPWPSSGPRPTRPRPPSGWSCPEPWPSWPTPPWPPRVLPAPGGGFDIPAFLADRGTVYLIAEAVSEEAPVAPLFAAMATEIHYVAAQIGQASPSGRLDPPLLMGLVISGLRRAVFDV